MKKTKKLTEQFLEALEKTPIVQHACDQIGISRNTYYRWRNEDPMFSTQVTDRLDRGIDRVNDFAENNVLNGIKNGDVGMTKYWLSARHKAYRRPFPPDVHQQIVDREKERLEQERTEKEIDEWLEGWFNPKSHKQRSTKSRSDSTGKSSGANRKRSSR